MAVKKAKSWVCVNPKNFQAAMNELRDLLNWLTVLEREYNITKKDSKNTRKTLEKAIKQLKLGLK